MSEQNMTVEEAVAFVRAQLAAANAENERLRNLLRRTPSNWTECNCYPGYPDRQDCPVHGEFAEPTPKARRFRGIGEIYELRNGVVHQEATKTNIPVTHIFDCVNEGLLHEIDADGNVIAQADRHAAAGK